ncbi:MAG: hypothetical protein PHG02_04245 [Oscillospiraceae bacterium]|nr:hypothetical protein [Oscillospiraceae bacterium]
MSDMHYDELGRFVQKKYGQKQAFSSFLPGIAGAWGVPMWCNYNNRGQCVCSFGAQDKDHAIMEFVAAHTAYQQVQHTGFRTFIKINDNMIEPFADSCGDMTIEANALLLSWENQMFAVHITYFISPQEEVPALCRTVEIKNKSEQTLSIEMLDGLAAIVPYGVKNAALKNEAQLSKAWMQVENLPERLPYYRVRASMEDSACVTTVESGNFAFAFAEDNIKLPVLPDAQQIFSWDTSLHYPHAFASQSLQHLLAEKSMTSNLFPSCFFAWQGKLLPSKSVCIYEMIGQANNLVEARQFANKACNVSFVEQKLSCARRLAAEIGEKAFCKTSHKVFDLYSQQNLLDNVLRGGYPFCLQNSTKPVYIYSRKHGDAEREYNYFSLSKEYFSQGNANFRDVCQNRRSDVLLQPSIKDENIHLFFDLIQIDGYNPLVLQSVQYYIKNSQALLQFVPQKYAEEAFKLFSKPFTLGQVAMRAQHWEINSLSDFISLVIENAQQEVMIDFKEGYWCDHWTYLLDLIETYLAVYPEKETELLFEDCSFRWLTPQAWVCPQKKRYVNTVDGLRQYHCLDKHKHEKITWQQSCQGIEIRSTLIEKIVFLCLIKIATLDMSGTAIEMEGGKPGWYDALNGLPGLLGASVADGCELLRLLQFAVKKLRSQKDKISLALEFHTLLENLTDLYSTRQNLFDTWTQRNVIRDAYRNQAYNSLSGIKIEISAQRLAQKLVCFASQLEKDINLAVQENNGICPTYYWYKATDIINTPESGVMPTSLQKIKMPLFLEGPVKWLKTKNSLQNKLKMVDAVYNSALYDTKLQMLKVNSSLQDTSYEIGRAKAFTAGWLENESIWLHMSYKYLLSLLQAGMYSTFFDAFKTTAVPFYSPEQYGRSTLENVSFLASSANPNPKIHGQGFVARLTGSTAEFISLWQGMFFGFSPFFVQDKKLCLQFCPALPQYLISEKQIIQATFLGKTSVAFYIEELDQLIPGQYIIKHYILQDVLGIVTKIEGSIISQPYAQQVREGKIQSVEVHILPLKRSDRE